MSLVGLFVLFFFPLNFERNRAKNIENQQKVYFNLILRENSL